MTEVNNWSRMSLGTFIKDLKFSLQHIKDFEKETIVSDRKWLEGLAAVSNTLFSSIEVKHFTFEEIDKALEWVSSWHLPEVRSQAIRSFDLLHKFFKLFSLISRYRLVLEIFYDYNRKTTEKNSAFPLVCI